MCYVFLEWFMWFVFLCLSFDIMFSDFIGCCINDFFFVFEILIEVIYCEICFVGNVLYGCGIDFF